MKPVVPSLLALLALAAIASPGAPARADELGQCAVILSITDIPGDQGRQVRIEWQRSGFDTPGSQYPALEYYIYREVDGLLRGAGGWDYLCTVPASAELAYSKVVPTLADSTVASGQYLSRFFVRTRIEGGIQADFYRDSEPAEGYSVDNLAPPPPSGLVATSGGSGNALEWEASTAPDFDYFNVYRGSSANFTPGPGNLVHQTSQTSWVDSPAGAAYYRLSAVDFSGNEGPTASAMVVTGTTPLPSRPRLLQNHPNPFNPTTTIRFEVAERGPVRLEVFDAAGRRVTTLVERELPAGAHEQRWSAVGLPSGSYFYRLSAGGAVQVRKAILAR